MDKNNEIKEILIDSLDELLKSDTRKTKIISENNINEKDEER